MHQFTTKLLSVYSQYGTSDYIGEPISQMSHMLQAAYFAERSGADNELILASFFHDIGHLCAESDAEEMDGLGIIDHEHIGAQFLLDHGCSRRVANLVAGHVNAKRYLCWRNPGYLERLSESSLGTLFFQGGPMETSEAKEFESSALHKDILRLRTWDEMAKVSQGPELKWERIQQILDEHIVNGGQVDETEY